MPTLTRTQRAALASLSATGKQWPVGRAVWDIQHDGRHAIYSKRTLQALVDAGLARWESRPGVMPHIIPMED